MVAVNTVATMISARKVFSSFACMLSHQRNKKIGRGGPYVAHRVGDRYATACLGRHGVNLPIDRFTVLAPAFGVCTPSAWRAGRRRVDRLTAHMVGGRTRPPNRALSPSDTTADTTRRLWRRRAAAARRLPPGTLCRAARAWPWRTPGASPCTSAECRPAAACDRSHSNVRASSGSHVALEQPVLLLRRRRDLVSFEDSAGSMPESADIPVCRKTRFGVAPRAVVCVKS